MYIVIESLLRIEPIIIVPNRTSSFSESILHEQRIQSKFAQWRLFPEPTLFLPCFLSFLSFPPLSPSPRGSLPLLRKGPSCAWPSMIRSRIRHPSLSSSSSPHPIRSFLSESSSSIVWILSHPILAIHRYRIAVWHRGNHRLVLDRSATNKRKWDNYRWSRSMEKSRSHRFCQ